MVDTTERMRPQRRIDPASADHIPVIEYSSGVTVLLFWATNTSVKSCVTSACSMAPVARRAPTSMTGASSRASAAVRSAGRALRWVAAGAGGEPVPALGDQPDDAHDDAGEAGQEGEPDADRPQVGVEHQQAGPVVVFFTRFGYWAA